MFIKYNDSFRNQLDIFTKKVIKKGNENLVSNDPFYYYKDKNLYKSNLWILIKENLIVASVIVKKQKYYVAGKLEEISFIRYPVSLATIDKKYLSSSITLIQNIKSQFPKSFLLGMGGSKSKTAKFFSTFGYVIKDLPFYIKPLNFFNILTQNHLTIKYFNIITKFKINGFNFNSKYMNNNYAIKEVIDFNKKDFENRKPISSFELEKTDVHINSLAPSNIKNFIKFRFYEKNVNVGNCTLFINQSINHKYFGNLKIAVFLDLYISEKCIDKKKTLNSLNHQLKKKNIDILIFNCGAKNILSILKVNKWIKYKSQWAIASSPELFKDINLDDMYLSRLDGDGPTNLGVDI